MLRMSEEKKQKIEQKILKSLPRVTEGICVRSYNRGQIELDLKVGTTYKYYDLASLTKILSTTTLTMWAVEEKKLDVTDPIQKWLPWFPKKEIQISHLLNHTSGLTWWKPFYKELIKYSSFEEKKQYLLEQISKDDIQVQLQSVYSDLGFMTLGFVLEACWNMPFYDLWQKLNSQLNAENLRYHINNKPSFDPTEYAPTEKCLWREKVIQGEVHDDNAWALGGVAPHAGLFGSIDDVGQWLMKIRGVLIEGKKWVYGSEVLGQFMKRSIPQEVGDWGLGFMKPTSYKPSCGTYFSKESFGHTGFTGTSLWYDPLNDFGVIILSNRTYPDRNNKKFVDLRPQIHNWIRGG